MCEFESVCGFESEREREGGGSERERDSTHCFAAVGGSGG